MKRGLLIKGFVQVDEKATADHVDEITEDFAIGLLDEIDEFATEVKVGGPEFQAYLHTPCSQYAG